MNACWTRHNNVYLAFDHIALSDEEFVGLFAHKVFHILTNHQPALVSPLYQQIGFSPLGQSAGFSLPPELAALALTNPDAPKITHYVEVTSKNDQQKHKAVMVLHGPAATATDYAQGFFEFLRHKRQISLLGVEQVNTPDSAAQWQALRDPVTQELRLWPLEQTDLVAIARPNTDYLLSPEEILAENFGLLVGKNGEWEQFPHRETIEAMEQFFIEQNR